VLPFYSAGRVTIQASICRYALRKKAYSALEAFLNTADPNIADIGFRSCDRTPLEEACVGLGNREALGYFLRRREKSSRGAAPQKQSSK
jgi:hypothetical protein